MKKVEINIPNMQSTHCQTRVKNALTEIEGVEIQKLEAGKLIASVASDNISEEVRKAIIEAGYSIDSMDESNASNCSTGCCAK